MKRLLSLFLFVVVLVVAIGGYTFVKGKFMSSAPEEDRDTKVLGATQQSFQSVMGSVGPAVDQAYNAVSSQVSAISDTVLKDDQKIQVDKAFEDIKNNAADIPENVFNDAKYNYCKSVVTDYEKTH